MGAFRSGAALFVGVALMGAAACGASTEPDGTPIAQMVGKVVTLTGRPGRYLSALLSAEGCPVLAAGATASLNDRQVQLSKGIHTDTPMPGMGHCYPPLAYADLADVTSSVLDLKITDASQTVSVQITGYHPFAFALGDLPQAVLHGGDAVSLPTPDIPDPPDQIVVSFFATHGTPSTAAWTVSGLMSGGQVSFTVPSGSVVDSGDLVVCGEYSVATKIESCLNATCTLDMFTRGDCRSYATSVASALW
jgi:hypothetical protein